MGEEADTASVQRTTPEGELLAVNPNATATAEKVWSKVKSSLSFSVNPATFGAHIKPLRLISIDDRRAEGADLTITVGAITAWSKAWIETHKEGELLAAITAAIQREWQGARVRVVEGGK